MCAAFISGQGRIRISAAVGLTDEDFEVFDRVKDKTPAEPLRFEAASVSIINPWEI